MPSSLTILGIVVYLDAVLLGHKLHRPLRKCRDGGERIHPDRSWNNGAVTDDQARVSFSPIALEHLTYMVRDPISAGPITAYSSSSSGFFFPTSDSPEPTLAHHGERLTLGGL